MEMPFYNAGFITLLSGKQNVWECLKLLPRVFIFNFKNFVNWWPFICSALFMSEIEHLRQCFISFVFVFFLSVTVFISFAEFSRSYCYWFVRVLKISKDIMLFPQFISYILNFYVFYCANGFKFSVVKLVHFSMYDFWLLYLSWEILFHVVYIFLFPF